MSAPDPVLVQISAVQARQAESISDHELRLHELEAKSPKRRVNDTPKWHGLTDKARELETAKLRGWVEQVGRPVFGMSLPACWERHLPAVVALEAIVELHATLYLEKRTTPAQLSVQAEFLIRVLPGLVDRIDSACRSCDCRYAVKP